MPSGCSVSGCTVRSHGFYIPKGKPEVWDQWMLSIGEDPRETKLRNLKEVVICRNHFRVQDMYRATAAKRVFLKADAVPTLHYQSTDKER